MGFFCSLGNTKFSFYAGYVMYYAYRLHSLFSAPCAAILESIDNFHRVVKYEIFSVVVCCAPRHFMLMRSCNVNISMVSINIYIKDDLMNLFEKQQVTNRWR